APQEQAPANEQDLPPVPAPTRVDQSPAASEAAPTRTAAAPRVAPPVNRQRMPAGYYPSAASQSTLSQMPGPVPVHTALQMQPNRRGGKPFQSVQSQPTISPYLYLNAGTSNANAMTNYFAFVRPQLDQMEASRQQQHDP